VKLGGSPHLKIAATEATASALRARLAIVFALAFAALTLGFGTARGMLLPLVTVALAQLWTFALLGVLDRPLNGVTATVPLLLAILGLVYSVHVISAYYDELRAAPERAPAESMVRALRRIALPMLLGALTTAVSLLAAVVTPVGALRGVRVAHADGNPGGVRCSGHRDSRAPARVRPADRLRARAGAAAARSLRALRGPRPRGRCCGDGAC